MRRASPAAGHPLLQCMCSDTSNAFHAALVHVVELVETRRYKPSCAQRKCEDLAVPSPSEPQQRSDNGKSDTEDEAGEEQQQMQVHAYVGARVTQHPVWPSPVPPPHQARHDASGGLTCRHGCGVLHFHSRWHVPPPACLCMRRWAKPGAAIP